VEGAKEKEKDKQERRRRRIHYAFLARSRRSSRRVSTSQKTQNTISTNKLWESERKWRKGSTVFNTTGKWPPTMKQSVKIWLLLFPFYDAAWVPWPKLPYLILYINSIVISRPWKSDSFRWVRTPEELKSSFASAWANQYTVYRIQLLSIIISRSIIPRVAGDEWQSSQRRQAFAPAQLCWSSSSALPSPVPPPPSFKWIIIFTKLSLYYIFMVKASARGDWRKSKLLAVGLNMIIHDSQTIRPRVLPDVFPIDVSPPK